VLVVVDVVTDVTVVAVHVVDVVEVGHGRVATTTLVHVHVSDVRGVLGEILGLLVHVIAVNEVDVAVVQEVDVTFVRDRRVPAEPFVNVRMLVRSKMLGVGRHRHLRRSR
jgi:hypothetical protein